MAAQTNLSVPLNGNTISIALAALLAFLWMGGAKGCAPVLPSPTPVTPAVGTIIPSPADLAFCAPIKAVAATADAAKRSRLSAAFMDLAVALNTAGDNIKTTGTLSDLIQTFSTIVSTAEPDLSAVLPSANPAFTSARDAWVNSLPGSGVDRPITKQQAASFVAAISKSLE